MQNPNIDRQFSVLLEKTAEGRRLRSKIGMSTQQAAVLRQRHGQGALSTDLKTVWLAKAGLLSTPQYSDADLRSLLQFYDKLSKSGKELGHDYAIEKWLAVRNRKQKA